MRTEGCNRRTTTVPARIISQGLLVSVIACSAAPASPVTVTNTTSLRPTSGPTATSTTTFALGDLAEFDPVIVRLGVHELTVAVADEDSERQRGLQGVTDFGEFEGMLFSWAEEVTTGFWMKDTHIPLDLFFFGADGALVDETTLEPCQVDPCPVYVSERLFRWVLESPAGRIAPEIDDRLAIP